MNLDIKILIKILQTKFNNILKGSYTIIKWDLFQECKTAYQVKQYTTLQIVG